MNNTYTTFDKVTSTSVPRAQACKNGCCAPRRESTAGMRHPQKTTTTKTRTVTMMATTEEGKTRGLISLTNDSNIMNSFLFYYTNIDEIAESKYFFFVQWRNTEKEEGGSFWMEMTKIIYFRNVMMKKKEREKKKDSHMYMLKKKRFRKKKRKELNHSAPIWLSILLFSVSLSLSISFSVTLSLFVSLYVSLSFCHCAFLTLLHFLSLCLSLFMSVSVSVSVSVPASVSVSFSQFLFLFFFSHFSATFLPELFILNVFVTRRIFSLMTFGARPLFLFYHFFFFFFLVFLSLPR